MFRARKNFAPTKQPLLRAEKVIKMQLDGATKIKKTVSFENPPARNNFDEYTLKDLIAEGVKLEQVPTKVLDNVPNLDDVPRETSVDENPF